MTRPGSITRRGLLQAGGAAALAACLAGAAAPAGALASGGGGAPAHLRRSTYTALAGSRELTAAGAAGPQTLTLDAVEDLLGAAHHAVLRGSDDAFALQLSGAAGEERLESGVHALSHPQLGSFELFLAPVDLPAGGQQYEVVVDRSVG